MLLVMLVMQQLKIFKIKKKIEENFVPGLKVGKIGIENSKDTDLIGNHVIKRYEVNASGKKISEISYNKETQGEN